LRIPLLNPRLWVCTTGRLGNLPHGMAPRRKRAHSARRATGTTDQLCQKVESHATSPATLAMASITPYVAASFISSGRPISETLLTSGSFTGESAYDPRGVKGNQRRQEQRNQASDDEKCREHDRHLGLKDDVATKSGIRCQRDLPHCPMKSTILTKVSSNRGAQRCAPAHDRGFRSPPSARVGMMAARETSGELGLFRQVSH